MAVLAIAYCCYGYSEVLHNAMLPNAGRPSALPYISGLGLSLGNILSVGILVFFLFGLLLPGSGLPFAPAKQVIQLDRETFAPERFAGPFVAVWMAVLLIPFFLFMPDGIKGGRSTTWKQAAADVFRGEDRHSGKAQNPIRAREGAAGLPEGAVQGPPADHAVSRSRARSMPMRCLRC
jgi:UMF1 family MFS transporter